MGVDLRGLEGSVFQDLLDIPQVGTLAHELRGKGVPKSMTSDTLLDTRSTRSPFDGSLHLLFSQVMTTLYTSAWIDRQMVCWKQVLPSRFL